MPRGRVEAAATSTTTSETSARHRTVESVTDLVLFGEVSDTDAAANLQEDSARHIEARLAGARVRGALYRLQFDLDEEVGAPVYRQNLHDRSQFTTEQSG